jgi:hypothetical protein
MWKILKEWKVKKSGVPNVVAFVILLWYNDIVELKTTDDAGGFPPLL